MYDIIRQNFLVGNRGSMTEEERQANISPGMKKAEYGGGELYLGGKQKIIPGSNGIHCETGRGRHS